MDGLNLIKIIALHVPNYGSEPAKLEHILKECDIALQNTEEEQKLIAEFDAVRKAYISEVSDVRSKYASRFKSILENIQELRQHKE